MPINFEILAPTSLPLASLLGLTAPPPLDTGPHYTFS